MPRPRFERLDPQKKEAILHAAAAEFAEQGFESASYNRIIQRAGVSKGAMYYYFDDKEDLLLTVLKGVVSHVAEVFGELPEVETADEFWSALDDASRKAVEFFVADPTVAGIVRSLDAVRRSGKMSPAMLEYYEVITGWTTRFLSLGQEVGAVRTDMPLDLLTAVANAAGEAMDFWLASHVDTLSPEEVEVIRQQELDIFRRICVPVECS